MKKGELISDLNTLIAVCKNSERGYRTAAGAVQPSRFHSLFAEYAEQRHRFATALQAEVNRLGGIPGKRGDLAGTVHRTWLNLKAIAAGGDPGAVIAECKVGENAALHVYGDIAQRDLPPDISALVERQYQAIRAARDRILALETQLNQLDDSNRQA